MPTPSRLEKRRLSRLAACALALGAVSWTAAALGLAGGRAAALPTAPALEGLAATGCAVEDLYKSDTQGLEVYSPDGSKYLVNRKDSNGIAQVYVGQSGSSAAPACVTCVQRSGGPAPDRFKMQPHWHPSGNWIFMAVERQNYSPPPVLGQNRDYVEGQLQNGLWTNMYAVSPDGQRWTRLTDFTGTAGSPDGFTGVAFTPDGARAVWSQIVDGNVLVYYPFGRWELIVADFAEQNGVPILNNRTNITPAGMNWNEPGNFAPDNESLVLTGSVERDAQGMDQYILNIRTGALRNLTNTPRIWDEHGVFSSAGDQIVFMSAYPYRNDPKTSTLLGIKTEFMLINRDGGGLMQLTHFLEPGYPEYSPSNNGIAAIAYWRPDGRSLGLARLLFPNYEYWVLDFSSLCGSPPQAPGNLRIIS